MMRKWMLAGFAALGLSIAPAAAQVTSTTGALASSQVIKGSGGTLWGFEVSADSTLYAAPWYVMIFDATSAPADGAVTPRKCYEQYTNNPSAAQIFTSPLQFTTGIVIVVSTTGCFNKTASTHAFISGEFQ